MEIEIALGQVSMETLEKQRQEFLETPRLLVARNAVANQCVLKACLNRNEVISQSHVFSNVLKIEGKATAQKSSGRCWLFAFCNTLRERLMAKIDLPLDFEISQPYLFFYDKLEKSNFFLQKMIDIDEGHGSRLIQYLLKNPLCDGGQYSMIQNLVMKYGLCPKAAYPETHCTSNSRRMRWILTTKLREFAKTLFEMKSNGASKEQLNGERLKMMQDVHRILLVFFGEPPQQFDWCYRQRGGEKEFCAFRGMNPISFYEKISETIGFKVEDQISLVHDPRNAENSLLTVDCLSNMVGGLNAKYVNVSIDVLKKVASDSIRSEEPVWFGCDVGKFSTRESGIMHDRVYDFDMFFGTNFGTSADPNTAFPPCSSSATLTKAERLQYGQSLMTHAMVFTGFDEVEGEIRKWRVENSWGTDVGKNGYYVMSDSWFDQYMYQVVVDKKFIPQEILSVLDQEPTILPAWDPMGSLA